MEVYSEGYIMEVYSEGCIWRCTVKGAYGGVQ